MTRKKFETFVSQNSNFLKFHALKLCSDELDAEDLVQSTLLKLWRFRSKFDTHKGKPITYATNIMRNHFIDEYRRGQNRTYSLKNRVSIESISSDSDENEFSNTIVLDTILGSDINEGEYTFDIEVINACIEKLPDIQKRLILLRASGYDYLTMSTKTNIKIDTVKAYLFRAREKLRALLIEEGIL